MKIQIDTTLKTISIEEVVNLQEMFDEIKKTLPGDLWKEYTFISKVEIVWVQPTPVIPAFPNYPYPDCPTTAPYYYGPTITEVIFDDPMPLVTTLP